MKYKIILSSLAVLLSILTAVYAHYMYKDCFICYCMQKKELRIKLYIITPKEIWI